MLEPIRFKVGSKFPTKDATNRNINAAENTKLYNGFQSSVYLPAFLERLKMNGVQHHTTTMEGNEAYVGYENETVRNYYSTVLQGVNYTKAVCQLYSNLLFSEGIVVSDYDDVRNSWLNGEENAQGRKISKGFIVDNDLQRKLLTGQREAGYKGNAVYLITAKENSKNPSGLKANITMKPAEQWYPVISDYDYSEKIGDALVEEFNVAEENTSQNKKEVKKILRVVIYEIGRNTYKAFQTDGSTIIAQVNWDENLLGAIPDGAIQEDMSWVEETGYDYSMLQVAYNDTSTDTLFGKSFITRSFKEQEREICIRATQRGRILDKNSDPGMTGPAKNIGVDPRSGKAIIQSQGKYFPTKKDDPEVKYVTWDGNLTDNIEAEKKAKEYIHVETGTNDASLSATAEGLATLSGSALEKVLMRPLSQAKTLTIQWTPIIENILRLGYQIETGDDSLFPSIAFNDGLPKSRAEDLADIMTANGNLPVMTHADSIQVAFPGYTRQQAEMQADLINAETNSRAPQELPQAPQTI